MTCHVWQGGVQVDFNQTIAAIQAADADITGLPEPDGNTARIAAVAGYPDVDLRRHFIARVPLFDSGAGLTHRHRPGPFSMAGFDRDAAHAWAMVAPRSGGGGGHLHLTSDPYGPDILLAGGTAEAALANEAATRLPEIAPLIAAGTPVFVTGDVNSPSHLN